MFGSNIAESSANVASLGASGFKGYLPSIVPNDRQNCAPRSFSAVAGSRPRRRSTRVMGSSSRLLTRTPTPAASPATENLRATCPIADFALRAASSVCETSASAAPGGALAAWSTTACRAFSAPTYDWFASTTKRSVVPGGITACTGWNAAPTVWESTLVFCDTSDSSWSSGDWLLPSCASFRAASFALPYGHGVSGCPGTATYTPPCMSLHWLGEIHTNCGASGEFRSLASCV